MRAQWVARVAMEVEDVRSQCWRSSLDAGMSEGRSERRECRTESRLERAVATMGREGGVLRRRCRVMAWPMPREEGVTKAHAMF